MRKCVSFSRNKYAQGTAQGGFNFLGFTFYWGRSHKGAPIPKVETCGKTIRTKLKNVKEWSRKIRNEYRLLQIWKMFCAKLAGYIQYFDVSFNVKAVSTFVKQAVEILVTGSNSACSWNSTLYPELKYTIPCSKLWLCNGCISCLLPYGGCLGDQHLYQILRFSDYDFFLSTLD